MSNKGDKSKYLLLYSLTRIIHETNEYFVHYSKCPKNSNALLSEKNVDY